MTGVATLFIRPSLYREGDSSPNHNDVITYDMLKRDLHRKGHSSRDDGLVAYDMSGVKASLLHPSLVSTYDTIVVIGAGVIGLCTAYHLAREACHRIIVVDALPNVFEATSGSNTGILSFNEFDTKLSSLGKYSYKLWCELGTDPLFRTTCGFRKSANFNVRHGSGKWRGFLPPWLLTQATWDACLEPTDGSAAIM